MQPTIRWPPATPLYWNVWGVIALHHEREASIERERALEAYRQNGDYYLAPEWYASVIAIAASAFAIEAWYGAIKGPLPQPGGPRRRRLLETLKLGFHLGRKTNDWLEEFDWLFKRQRDGLVHPPTKAGVPVPIDGVPGFVHSRVHNDQSPQQATRAVDLLCDVLETCAEGPRATYPELVELVDQYRLSIYDVLKRRYKGPPYY